MRIKNIKIYFIKKKQYESIYPRPTFHRQGFVFIKLISEDNIEGFGEPSPYITSPKNLIKIIEKIYIKYFQKKNLNISYVKQLKKKSQNNLLNLLLPAFDQAIFEIFSKEKNTSVAKVLNKKALINLDFYASGGMFFEGQNYQKMLNEAVKSKSDGYLGYKYRPLMPKNNLSHKQRMKDPAPLDIKAIEIFSSKLRAKLGSKFKIMIDLGCRCKNIKDTKYLFEMFKEHNYYFVEEPFKRHFRSYKILDKIKTKINIAGGEHINNIQQFYNWNKKKYFKFFQPDTNLMLFNEINLMINKIGHKKIILHNWCNKINFLSNINFALSLKNKILIEKNIIPNPYDNFFNTGRLEVKNGKIDFKETIGYGLKIKNSKLQNLEIYEKKI
jgi:L-alanine-DL-glutamate epimerase-like enolase superfamily enzyme|tara:strand:+ start:717 stop:1868 length:1152 start_codon:yes stop_codon:yes gene_type:complete